jgi:hypothetical protein
MDSFIIYSMDFPRTKVTEFPREGNTYISTISDFFMSQLMSLLLGDNDRQIKYMVWNLVVPRPDGTNEFTNLVYYIDYDARMLLFTNLRHTLFFNFKTVPVESSLGVVLEMADGIRLESDAIAAGIDLLSPAL